MKNSTHTARAAAKFAETRAQTTFFRLKTTRDSPSCMHLHIIILPTARHMLRFRSPVLDVQVYNRRRTHLVTKPACSAPMNHRSCSKSMTMGVCVCVLVCVLGVRHELYMSCAPASLCHPHAAHYDLCCLLAPRRNLQGTRAAWAVCSGAARRCCVHATGVIL